MPAGSSSQVFDRRIPCSVKIFFAVFWLLLTELIPVGVFKSLMVLKTLRSTSGFHVSCRCPFRSSSKWISYEWLGSNSEAGNVIRVWAALLSASHEDRHY